MRQLCRSGVAKTYRDLRHNTEIVHKEQSHPGEHMPIIDQPLWDAVQAQLAGNAAERNSSARHQPNLLAGLLFDGDGNRMTPSHAVKNGTRYRYYVSGSLITKDRTDNAAALRIPAAEIEQLVSGRVHRWLLDPDSIYKSTSARLADASIQHRLVAWAAEIGKHWPELPVARKRAVLTTLIERIDVSLDRIDIRLRARHGWPRYAMVLIHHRKAPTTRKPSFCPYRYGCVAPGGSSEW